MGRYIFDFQCEFSFICFPISFFATKKSKKITQKKFKIENKKIKGLLRGTSLGVLLKKVTKKKNRPVPLFLALLFKSHLFSMGIHTRCLFPSDPGSISRYTPVRFSKVRSPLLDRPIGFLLGVGVLDNIFLAHCTYILCFCSFSFLATSYSRGADSLSFTSLYILFFFPVSAFFYHHFCV